MTFQCVELASLSAPLFMRRGAIFYRMRQGSGEVP
jgi:hypothetical protein